MLVKVCQSYYLFFCKIGSLYNFQYNPKQDMYKTQTSLSDTDVKVLTEQILCTEENLTELKSFEFLFKSRVIRR